MGNFFDKGRKLAEDVGIAQFTPPNTVIQSPPLSSDIKGVDNLILALLTGMETVSQHLKRSSLEINTEPWSVEFQRLMALLRG